MAADFRYIIFADPSSSKIKKDDETLSLQTGLDQGFSSENWGR
jgi:hypothetical protein